MPEVAKLMKTILRLREMFRNETGVKVDANDGVDLEEYYRLYSEWLEAKLIKKMQGEIDAI